MRGAVGRHMDSEENSELEETLEQIGLPLGAGAELRAAREERRLSLEHVAAETRIPTRHLETLEAGAFDELPSRTYAIGFARSYARSVGLDDEKIATMVREEMGDARPRYSSLGTDLETDDPAKLPSRALAWFAGAAALILAIGVISFGGTYFGSGVELASLLPDSDTAPVSEPAPGNDPVLATLDQAADPETPPAQPSADGQVVFTALGESGWVRFYEKDGEVLFEGFMEEGDTYAVPADAQDPWINTGRANQYTITIDGQNVPLLAEEMIQMQAPISGEALLMRETS